MITLYHCIDARSFRPLWALEELRLSYALRMLPFPPRVHAKHYREVNPLGTIPLFIDDDVRLTESAAICQYLAARHGQRELNVESDEGAFGDYLNFLHFGESTLTFPQTLVLRYAHFEPPERRSSQVADDYEKWFLARLRTLEGRLANASWICGDRFTAADISVGYALLLASYLDLAPRFGTSVSEYWRRLQARPAYDRARCAQLSAAQLQGVPTTPAPLTGRMPSVPGASASAGA